MIIRERTTTGIIIHTLAKLALTRPSRSINRRGDYVKNPSRVIDDAITVMWKKTDATT